jgi:methionine-rich copper-binding protein CopC
VIVRSTRSGGSPGHRYLSRRVRFGTGLAVVLAGLLLGAGPALAHDVLEKTNPGENSTVRTLPDDVELTFNNIPLGIGSVIKVTGPGGDVTEGKTSVLNHVVSTGIAPGSPAGAYTVQWRVTSSDGHPISGQFAFTAEAGNGGSAATGSTGADTGSPASAAQAVNPADQDSGGSSPVLIITLVVLAVVVIGAVLYLFVFSPKRSGES